MRKSGMGWFTGVGLVAMLLAIGNLIYTCTRNNGEKYAQQYIDESEYVTLHIPERIKDVTYRAGGMRIGILMNSTKRITIDRLAFYDKYYKKYFCVFVIEPEHRGTGEQGEIVVNDIRYRKTIKARINKYELNSPRYGSKANPVPVLDFDYKIAHFQNDKNSKYYKYAFSRPAYYKRAVELYLTYMMSKEEFKERFEKE